MRMMIKMKRDQYSPNSTLLVTSRLDTTRHVRRVERGETSVSSRAVRQDRHIQNAWTRHVEHVVSCRDVTWRVKRNMGLCQEPLLRRNSPSIFLLL